MTGGRDGLPEQVSRFNWGAFFLPPIWGVAHGQWPGVFFLPLWVFVDNMLRGPRPFGAWSVVLGVSMAFITVGFQAAYAYNANRFAWARTGGRVEPGVFACRQRAWGIAGILVTAAMAAWIVMFLLDAG